MVRATLPCPNLRRKNSQKGMWFTAKPARNIFFPFLFPFQYFYTTELILIIHLRDTTFKYKHACFYIHHHPHATFHRSLSEQCTTLEKHHSEAPWCLCLPAFLWSFRNSQREATLTQVKARCLVCVRNRKV